MTIAEGDDVLLPLAQLAAELPRRKGGRPTSKNTLYSWTREGCRGIKLAYVQIGATRCTSRRAMTEFFRQLTAQAEAAYASNCSGGVA